MAIPPEIEMHPFPPEIPKGTPPPSGGPEGTKKKIDEISEWLRNPHELEELQQKEAFLLQLKEQTLQSARANMPLKWLFGRISKALSETVFGWFFEKRATRPIDALLTTTIEKLFRTAITAGDSVEVERLIDAKHDVNALVDGKNSPLFLAVMQKKPEIAELLIKGGASLSKRVSTLDSAGVTVTPLSLAAKNGDAAMVKLLLEKGANIHEVNCWEWSVLDLALDGQHWDTVGVLLDWAKEKKIKLKCTRTNWGSIEADKIKIAEDLLDTALVAQSSKDRALVGAVAGKNLEMVNLLLTHGARQIDNWYGFTLDEAVKTGELPIVKALLDNHPVRSHFKAALDSAIYSDQTDIAIALLVAGADPNKVHIYENLPDPQPYENLLHHCVKRGDREAVRSLVAHGARQITDSAWKTPLHYAIEMGDEELVDILLEVKPNLNEIEIEGVMSPLATAIKDHKTSIALKLLAAGASPNTRGISKERGRLWLMSPSPLHYAIEAGDVELIKALIQKGASLVVKDSGKGIPCPFELAIKNNKEDVLDELFDAITQQNVNMRFPNGETPLILAIRSGRTKYVRDLIGKGAHLNMLDERSNNNTPLLEATGSNNKEIVEILLEAGAKPDVKDWFGQGRTTPLGLAAEKGYLDIVNSLLVHKANPGLEINISETALNCAVRGGHEEVVKLLLEKIIDPTTHKLKIGGLFSDSLARLSIEGICSKKPSILRALMDAGVMGVRGRYTGEVYLETLRKNWNTDIAEFLLDNGMDPNVQLWGSNHSFLNVAIKKDDPKIVKKLLEVGVDPNDERFDITFLFIAIEHSTAAVVFALLEGGADPNKLYRGDTPLHVAVKKGNIDIIKALLANGADPTVKNTGDAFVFALLEGGADPNRLYRGDTPLHVAVKKGNIDIIKALLDNGVDPTVKNTGGKVPSDLAPDGPDGDKIRSLFTRIAGK